MFNNNSYNFLCIYSVLPYSEHITWIIYLIITLSGALTDENTESQRGYNTCSRELSSEKANLELNLGSLTQEPSINHNAVCSMMLNFMCLWLGYYTQLFGQASIFMLL